MKVTALILSTIVGCSAAPEPSSSPTPLVAHVVPAGHLPFGWCDEHPPEPGQTCALEERAWGCDDLEAFEIPPGSCLRIATELWGSVEDDVACWTLSDAPECSRTCAGYLEIGNGGPDPLHVRARSKVGEVSVSGTCAPGIRYAGGPVATSVPQPGTSY